MSTQSDEPLTPAGRLFLRPEMSVIIHCTIAVKHPININAFKAVVENSFLIKHPRFTSLLVVDSHGCERWRRSNVTIDNHVIIRNEPVGDVNDGEKAVNDYLADLSVSSPMDRGKPLWEVHLLMAHKCVVVRAHHALGDGVSLMSLLLTCCRKVDDADQLPEISYIKKRSVTTSTRSYTNVANMVRKWVALVWLTMVFVLEFMLRSLWKKDKRTVVSGGDGVELWPRKMTTARFKLDDMKTVKSSIAGAGGIPVSPASRFLITPQMTSIIHCIVAGQQPIDIDAAKCSIENSILVTHPRFTSLLVTDNHRGVHWRKTKVDIDRHIIIHPDPVAKEFVDDDEAVNEFVADLSVSTPMDLDKPPWEIHLLMAHRGAVFRFHHALGDGISFMSALLTGCRRVEEPDRMPQVNAYVTPKNNDNYGMGSVGGNVGKRAWGLMVLLWNTVMSLLDLVLRSLWKMDERTVLSGGVGVELWPRKLVTAKFRLDDMKTVKASVADATINDVLFGVISLGLSRYLDIRTPNAIREGVQLTGLAMVNLRPQPGLQDVADLMRANSKTRWGNQFGMVLLPVYYHRYGGSDPLLYVKRAKEMVDRKKQSLEAYFSYKIGSLVMSLLGSKFAGLLNYRICCNTTFTFSNVVGPKEEVTIAGNPVEYIRASSTSIPHAITMHMVSYAGRADMQILVAKDIIPDPQVLAKCFEDALLDMKEAAIKT